MEKDSLLDPKSSTKAKYHRKDIKMNKTVVSAFIAAVIVAVAAFAYQSYTGTSTTEAPMPAAELNGIASSSGEAAADAAAMEAAPAVTEEAPAADAAATTEAAPAADAAATTEAAPAADAAATTEEAPAADATATTEEEKAAE